MSISSPNTSLLKSKIYGMLGRDITEPELEAWINETFYWIYGYGKFSAFQLSISLTSTGSTAYDFSTLFPATEVFYIDNIVKVDSLTAPTESESLIPIHSRVEYLRIPYSGLSSIYFNVWNDKVWINPDTTGNLYVISYYGFVNTDSLDYPRIYKQFSSAIINKVIAFALRDNMKPDLSMQYEQLAENEMKRIMRSDSYIKNFYGSSEGMQVK